MTIFENTLNGRRLLKEGYNKYQSSILYLAIQCIDLRNHRSIDLEDPLAARDLAIFGSN